MAIPFFRLNDYLSLQLVKNFESIQLVPADEEFLYIIGIKREKRLQNKDVNIEELNRLKDFALSFEDEVEYTDETFLSSIVLPSGNLEVEKFRGGNITEQEMKAIYQNTQSSEEFWKAQEVTFTSKRKQNPLLPFTIGQIGLILTSGILDGVIDEGGGFKHLVKGRVKKFTNNDAEIESQKNKMNVTEVTGNRVEINVFLPDGTYKELA